jgi:hypothetical protein
MLSDHPRLPNHECLHSYCTRQSRARVKFDGTLRLVEWCRRVLRGIPTPAQPHFSALNLAWRSHSPSVQRVICQHVPNSSCNEEHRTTIFPHLNNSSILVDRFLLLVVYREHGTSDPAFLARQISATRLCHNGPGPRFTPLGAPWFECEPHARRHDRRHLRICCWYCVVMESSVCTMAFVAVQGMFRRPAS